MPTWIQDLFLRAVQSQAEQAVSHVFSRIGGWYGVVAGLAGVLLLLVLAVKAAKFLWSGTGLVLVIFVFLTCLYFAWPGNDGGEPLASRPPEEPAATLGEGPEPDEDGIYASKVDPIAGESFVMDGMPPMQGFAGVPGMPASLPIVTVPHLPPIAMLSAPAAPVGHPSPASGSHHTTPIHASPIVSAAGLATSSPAASHPAGGSPSSSGAGNHAGSATPRKQSTTVSQSAGGSPKPADPPRHDASSRAPKHDTPADLPERPRRPGASPKAPEEAQKRRSLAATHEPNATRSHASGEAVRSAMPEHRPEHHTAAHSPKRDAANHPAVTPHRGGEAGSIWATLFAAMAHEAITTHADAAGAAKPASSRVTPKRDALAFPTAAPRHVGEALRGSTSLAGGHAQTLSTAQSRSAHRASEETFKAAPFSSAAPSHSAAGYERPLFPGYGSSVSGRAQGLAEHPARHAFEAPAHTPAHTAGGAFGSGFGSGGFGAMPTHGTGTFVDHEAAQRQAVRQMNDHAEHQMNMMMNNMMGNMMQEHYGGGMHPGFGGGFGTGMHPMGGGHMGGHAGGMNHHGGFY